MPDTPLPQKTKGLNLLWLCLYFAAAGAALWWNQEAFAKLQRIPAGSLAVLVAGQALLVLGSGFFNFLLYRAAKVRISPLRACSLVGHGQAFDQLMPRGGLLFRVAAMRVYLGLAVPFHLALMSLGVLSIALSSLSLALSASWALSLGGPKETGELLRFCIGALAGVAVLAAAWPWLIRSVSGKIKRLSGLAVLTEILPRSLLPVLAATVVNQLFYVILLKHTFAALGFEASFYATILYGCAATLATTLGMMPGGLGVLELALVAVGKIHQLGAEDALLAALLLRTSSIVALFLLVPAFAWAAPWRR